MADVNKNKNEQKRQNHCGIYRYENVGKKRTLTNYNTLTTETSEQREQV